MNYFLKKQLEIIATEADIQEKSAQRTKQAIRAILLFEAGEAYYDYTHKEQSSTATTYLGNGYQEIVSEENIKKK